MRTTDNKKLVKMDFFYFDFTILQSSSLEILSGVYGPV